MSTETWSDRGTKCEMKESSIELSDDCTMKSLNIYFRIPKTHPHHGFDLKFFIETYGEKYNFFFASTTGVVGIQSGLDLKDTLKLSRDLCKNLFVKDPSNEWKISLKKQMKETLKDMKKKNLFRGESMERTVITESGNVRMCVECGKHIIVNDTICHYCGHRYNLWNLPAKNSYWSSETQKAVYF